MAVAVVGVAFMIYPVLRRVADTSVTQGLALWYVGGEPCTEDTEVLKKARDALMAAKPKWLSMDYGMTEKMAANDVMASVYWNGAIFRARLQNEDVKYGYPKEGYPLWMDSVGLLADAQNVDEAYKFLDFIMVPENAAMISAKPSTKK